MLAAVVPVTACFEPPHCMVDRAKKLGYSFTLTAVVRRGCYKDRALADCVICLVEFYGFRI